MSNEVVLTLSMLMKLMLITYLINKNHIINSLIILEMMVILLTTMMFMQMNNLNSEMYLMFFFLILMVTESILGLSILILMIRTHSNDYMKSASILI